MSVELLRLAATLDQQVNQRKAKRILNEIADAVSKKYLLSPRRGGGQGARYNLNRKNTIRLIKKRQRKPLSRFKLDFIFVSMITDKKLKIVYPHRTKSGMMGRGNKSFRGPADNLVDKAVKFIMAITDDPL